MNLPRGKKPQFKITPESTKAWTLAFYPAVIILVVVFIVITNRPITTELIGLCVGLLTAGSLKVAIKKSGENDDNVNSNGDSPDDLRNSGDQKLASDNRSRPNNFDRWWNNYFRLWSNEVGGLPI